MLCLSDNDFILKLAEYDLLKEAMHALNISRKDVRILPRAKYVFPTKIGKNHTRDGVDRALKFIDGLSVISDIDREEHIRLSRVVGIDSGEATLFAATNAIPDYLIATGDKRCLRAIASSTDCTDIAARIQGRIICLEQMIIRLIRFKNFEWVSQHVGSGVGDFAMEKAFAGGRIGWKEIDCMAWLNRYVDDLRAETGSLLIA